ncbi:MAG: methyltransferase domain-containing protein [Candidatus Peribacteraceae bacterium]|nr:methyltransferase domain-containing protein [Candidatus Peribacteraceae bacterium]
MPEKRIIPFEEKIAIGLPRGSDTRYPYEFIESLMKMMGKSPCNYRMITTAKVHHIARNKIIADFLKSDMNYLLFIDSDMIWEPESLEQAYQLLQHNMVDLVTGIYYTKSEPHLPVIKKLDLKAGCYNIFMEWSNEPFEVDGAGLGFMLIPRYVLEKMKQPMCTWDGGFSEDLNFCLKAKKDHNFRIWAHPGIKLGHLTTKVVTSFDWVQQHKPSVKAYVREAMYKTTKYLREEYPGWRKLLGIHPLDFKNINTGKYWDKIYEDEGFRETWRTYPQKYDHISKNLFKGLKPDAKVLELGCGVGIFASKLKKEHLKFIYHGVDISEKAIGIMRKEGFKADVMKLPPLKVKDKHDLIFGMELLEHLDDKPRLQLIKEVSENLTEKGIAIFTVPDNCFPPDDIAEHRIMFDMKSFTKFLGQIFDGVSVESVLTNVSHKTLGKENFLIAVCKMKGGDK